MDIENRVRQLSAYASPFAASEPIAPSRSRPSDHVGSDPSRMRFLFDTRGLAMNPAEIEAALAVDLAPIPASQNREGYGGDDDFHYWLSGYAEYRRLTQIAAENGIDGGTLFDFGGSTGRVFRNFHYQGGWKIWSSDFKRSSVEWNLANFPATIRAF